MAGQLRGRQPSCGLDIPDVFMAAYFLQQVSRAPAAEHAWPDCADVSCPSVCIALSRQVQQAIVWAPIVPGNSAHGQCTGLMCSSTLSAELQALAGATVLGSSAHDQQTGALDKEAKRLHGEGAKKGVWKSLKRIKEH